MKNNIFNKSFIKFEKTILKLILINKIFKNKNFYYNNFN